MRMLGLLCATILVLGLNLTYVYAQAGEERRAEEQTEPYRKHHDKRHGHDHVYPDRGAIVRNVPRGTLIVNYAGLSYRYHDGVWFEPRGPAFMVVEPPIGVTIPTLPSFATPVAGGGEEYLYANGAYYRPRPELGGYEVVNEPGEVTPASRTGAAAGTASGAVVGGAAGAVVGAAAGGIAGATPAAASPATPAAATPTATSAATPAATPAATSAATPAAASAATPAAASAAMPFTASTPPGTSGTPSPGPQGPQAPGPQAAAAGSATLVGAVGPGAVGPPPQPVANTSTAASTPAPTVAPSVRTTTAEGLQPAPIAAPTTLSAGSSAISSVSPTAPRVFLYPKSGQGPDQQARDRYECYRFAVAQTGFDPMHSSAGAPHAEQQSDYERAQAACFEGRGYTIR